MYRFGTCFLIYHYTARMVKCQVKAAWRGAALCSPPAPSTLAARAVPSHALAAPCPRRAPPPHPYHSPASPRVPVAHPAALTHLPAVPIAPAAHTPPCPLVHPAHRPHLNSLVHPTKVLKLRTFSFLQSISNFVVGLPNLSKRCEGATVPAAGGYNFPKLGKQFKLLMLACRT